MADKSPGDELYTDVLAKRRVACMATFLHPFRIVNGPESGPWDVSVEDVNRRGWDYVALHEVVGGLDVGLEPPYHMVVCRDGAVGLPPIPELTNDQQSVEFFNRSLAALLLGGIYCEAVALDGLDIGSIIDWKYLRIHSHAPAAANTFHRHVRLQQASALEAIALSSPRILQLAELSTAMTAGRSILDAIPELSGEFLLKGVTGIARREWGAALANLWIVIEQITSHLWRHNVLNGVEAPRAIPGRADQLSDTRTWTIAARHELLHQIGVIPHSTLGELAAARKARNDLSHKGRHPPVEASRSAYTATLDLLKIAAPDAPIRMLDIDLSNHEISDPFCEAKIVKHEPTHWMEMPKLPGELNLERLEAKQVRRHQ